MTVIFGILNGLSFSLNGRVLNVKVLVGFIDVGGGCNSFYLHKGNARLQILYLQNGKGFGSVGHFFQCYLSKFHFTGLKMFIFCNLQIC